MQVMSLTGSLMYLCAGCRYSMWGSYMLQRALVIAILFMEAIFMYNMIVQKISHYQDIILFKVCRLTIFPHNY